MRLFDRFRKPSIGSDFDRILSQSQIQEILASDYGRNSDAIFLVYAPSTELITPIEMMLFPFIRADLSKDPKLSMVYRTGSGFAFVIKAVIVKFQALARTGLKNNTSCQAFIDAIRQLSYSVRQDPKLSLDLLP